MPEQKVTRLFKVLPLILAAVLEYAVLTAVKYVEIKLVPVYEPTAAVQVLAMLTPPLLLRAAPAIICSGVNMLATMCYPANTSGLPCAMLVQPDSESPNLAKALPFTNTDSLPRAIGGA